MLSMTGVSGRSGVHRNVFRLNSMMLERLDGYTRAADATFIVLLNIIEG